MQCIRGPYVVQNRRDLMNDTRIPLDHDVLSELLNDEVMMRIVNVLNLVSLSILELLEYGFNRREISRAMAKGIIEFDKAHIPSPSISRSDVVQQVLDSGDYYFGHLSGKIKLTKLGLHMLEIMETSSATEQANAHRELFQEIQEEALGSPSGPSPRV